MFINNMVVPSQPSRAGFLLELLAIKDVASLLHPRTNRIIPEYAKSAKHVVLLPAYGTDKRYLKPLTKCLKRHGHKVYDWGLGVNDAGIRRTFNTTDLAATWSQDATGKSTPLTHSEMGISYLCSRMVKRLVALHDIIQMPIVLIGWNLGGTIAMEVARDLPNQVSHVITLGTPSLGGSKYTVAADSFRNNGLDLDWIEQQLLKRQQQPIEQTITSIHGKYDGVISKSACQKTGNEYAQVLEERCSHVGLMYHYRVWQDVLKVLSQIT